VHGTLAELEAQAGVYGDDYLRVYLREPTRAGLRDDAVEILPNALEVRIDPEFAPQSDKAPKAGRGPHRQDTGSAVRRLLPPRGTSSDPRVAALFGELHDEVTAAAHGGDGGTRR